MIKVTLVSILTLLHLHRSQDNTQFDLKTIDLQMSTLANGLLDNIDKKDEYLRQHHKEITQMLKKTESSINNKMPDKTGDRTQSFGDIKTYRIILQSAMEEKSN